MNPYQPSVVRVVRQRPEKYKVEIYSEDMATVWQTVLTDATLTEAWTIALAFNSVGFVIKE